jgi:hypothetical protein
MNKQSHSSPRSPAALMTVLLEMNPKKHRSTLRRLRPAELEKFLAYVVRSINADCRKHGEPPSVRGVVRRNIRAWNGLA